MKIADQRDCLEKLTQSSPASPVKLLVSIKLKFSNEVNNA